MIGYSSEKWTSILILLNKHKNWFFLAKCSFVFQWEYRSANHPSTTIQYNAALAIAGAIRDISREKLYQKLGLVTLQQRRWCKKLCCFYKLLKSQSPKYLYPIILMYNMSYRTRQCNEIPAINVKNEFFKNTFFSSIIELNKLDWQIKNSESIETFKKINSIIH